MLSKFVLYKNNYTCKRLPLGTGCNDVTRTGSLPLSTVPNSEAHVSPLQHANAPEKMK